MNIETTKGLQKYQQEKREDSRTKILQAIEKLQESNADVNFKNVSVEAGISRKTLYKVEEFRRLIKEKRGDQNEDGYKETILKQEARIKSLQKTIDELKNDKTKLDLIKTKLKNIQEKIEGIKNESRQE